MSCSTVVHKSSGASCTNVTQTIDAIVVDNQVEPEFETESRWCNWPLGGSGWFSLVLQT